jgi:hypothetical protein
MYGWKQNSLQNVKNEDVIYMEVIPGEDDKDKE